MSEKEIRRLRVLHRIETGTLKLKEAAAMLGLCTKQMGRIWKRFRGEGEFGLAHRSRGMPGNRCKDAALRSRALELYRTKYPDFGPTLAAEKMKERDGLDVNRETLRRWLWGACLWRGKRSHSLHRKRRCRKEHFGEMVQMDGSDHAWLEERGERCCLMVMVDDATGHTEAHFCRSETTRDALLLLLKWIKKHGVPSKLYTDRKNIYVTDRPPTEDEKRQGTGALTEFGQVCARLGIQIIPAGSPQAKGRIERKNGVLQDRLVKELRLRGVTCIENANELLDPFLEDLNLRFRVAPAHEANHHKELPPGETLEHLFRTEKKRRLQNDGTFEYEGMVYQVTPPVPHFHPRKRLTVCQHLDGTLQTIWDGHIIAHQAIEKKRQGKRDAPPLSSPETPSLYPCAFITNSNTNSPRVNK